MKKKIYAVILIAAILAIAIIPGSVPFSAVESNSDENYVVGAYITPWNWSGTPDPNVLTHIYWCFADVNITTHRVELNRTVRSWDRQTQTSRTNDSFLRELVALKEENPDLKVLLSVGGAEGDGFSQAARTKEGRQIFAESCKELVDEFDLDGIDLDWENPVNGGWGTIEAIPEDFDNFPLLCDELRAEIGEDKLITMADSVTYDSANWFDYKNLDRSIDYYHMMGYCFTAGYPGRAHEGNLYASQYAAWGGVSVEMGINMHLQQGVSPEKILIGTNFYTADYTNGLPPSNPFYSKVAEYLQAGYQEEWDAQAKASYLSKDGVFTLTYESPRAIFEKSEYIKAGGYGGMMYWEYGQDDDARTLSNAVWGALNGEFDLPLDVYVVEYPSSVEIAQPITLRAEALWGTGEYEYRYLVLQEGKILYENLDFSTDATASFTPYDTYPITVIVYARDKTGEKACAIRKLNY